MGGKRRRLNNQADVQVGSMWITAGNRNTPNDKTVVRVVEVKVATNPADNKEDVYIHVEPIDRRQGGHNRRGRWMWWDRTFKFAARVQKYEPAAETYADAKFATGAHGTNSVDPADAAAALNLLVRIADAAEALVMLWSGGKPKPSGPAQG